MPYRRRGRRRYYRRRRKPYKYRNKPQTVTINEDFKQSLSKQIVPRQHTTKLVYTTKFVMNQTTGTVWTYAYRGNSLYDPDYTGVGHQPRGYDQLAALYKGYRVNGCKLELMGVSPATGDGGCMEIVAFPTVEVNDLTAEDPEYLAELPGASMMILNQGESKKVTLYNSTASALGITKQKARNDDIYTASVGYNPSIVWYYQLLAQVSDESTTMDAFLYLKLTYYVTWYEPIQLTLS